MKREYKFKKGDGCRVRHHWDVSAIKNALINRDYSVYNPKAPYDEHFSHFYMNGNGAWMQCDPILVSNEIPYNDMLCLIKGELPESWSIRCTHKDFGTEAWGQMIRTIGGHQMPESYTFYGMNGGTLCGDNDPFGTEIQLSTWVAIQELNNPTLEDEVNAIDACREPEFDPSKEFEVSDDGVNWQKSFAGNEIIKYHGTNVNGKPIVENCIGAVLYFEYIRNIEPFHAGMLEVGEYMESEPGPDGIRNLIKKISEGVYLDIRNGSSSFYYDIACQIKGRKVIVEHVIKEV
jgi:hypothetical protein